nr:MAG TPA: hypothetical protein [Caudoviricetes sp.]
MWQFFCYICKHQMQSTTDNNGSRCLVLHLFRRNVEK